MNLPYEFNYYINKKIVRKITPDVSRSEFLMDESRKSYEGLKRVILKIGIDKLNANLIIKETYDIIMRTIRSKMLVKGFTSSGNYAHEAEISYMKIIGFDNEKIGFVNVLRAARNGINYYGKGYNVEYAKECWNFLKKNHLDFLK